MATLKQQAAKRLERVNRGQLPHWWRAGIVVSAAAGLVVFGFSALAPTVQPNVPGRLSQFALPSEVPQRGTPPVSVPLPPDPEGAVSEPAPPQPVAPELVEDAAPGPVPVPSLSGGLVQVPSGAVSAARLAAGGVFSGDLAGVLLAPGFTLPPRPTLFASPVVSDLFVHSGGGDLFTFVAAVDPDGPGPEPQRPVRVTLERTAGGWVLSGVG